MLIVVVLILAVFAALIGLRLIIGSNTSPWGLQMTRVNPGSPERAEWIAPSDVVEAVQHDYMSFYHYVAHTLPKGWVPYLRDLNDYLCDEMLREQRESLDVRMQHNRGRMFDIVRANHSVQVRHFSGDGLRCVVIDHQSEQRMATYDYWSGVRLHTQDLGSATYVYEMQFDLRTHKWKIARYIQMLPPGTFVSAGLEITLPQTVGRDQ